MTLSIRHLNNFLFHQLILLIFISATHLFGNSSSQLLIFKQLITSAIHQISNSSLCQFVISTTLYFSNSSFLQFIISADYHFNIMAIHHLNNSSWQFIISTTHHFGNSSFQHHGYSSSQQLIISALVIYHFINPSFQQLICLAIHHLNYLFLGNSSFQLLISLSTCHLYNSSFQQLVISATHHFSNSSHWQFIVSTTHHSENSSLQRRNLSLAMGLRDINWTINLS